MQKFLSKFLSEEQVKTVTDAYKAKNKNAEKLPEYVGKTRLDEVITARDSYKSKLDAIPNDWQKQLEDSKKQYETEVAEHSASKKTIEELKNSANIDNKLYKAKARNVKAARALLDMDKPIDEEIARLQKEESYLFGSGKPPAGTGKDNDRDGDKSGDGVLSEESMRAALGI